MLQTSGFGHGRRTLSTGGQKRDQVLGQLVPGEASPGRRRPPSQRQGPGPPHAIPDCVPKAPITRPPLSLLCPGLSRRGVFSASCLGSPRSSTSQVSTIPRVSRCQSKKGPTQGLCQGPAPTVKETGVARPCHAGAPMAVGMRRMQEPGRAGLERSSPQLGAVPSPAGMYISADPPPRPLQRAHSPQEGLRVGGHGSPSVTRNSSLRRHLRSLDAPLCRQKHSALQGR